MTAHPPTGLHSVRLLQLCEVVDVCGLHGGGVTDFGGGMEDGFDEAVHGLVNRLTHYGLTCNTSSHRC